MRCKLPISAGDVPIAGIEDDPNTLGHEENAMSNPWFVRTLVASVAILIPLSVSAQDAPEYRCVLEDLQRRVVIFSETGVIVPCEVHYFKDTEASGEREVLWRALNESGYCEAQAQAFVEKLEGWGWACDMIAPAEAVDDTEDLAPATEPEADG